MATNLSPPNIFAISALLISSLICKDLSSFPVDQMTIVDKVNKIRQYFTVDVNYEYRLFSFRCDNCLGDFAFEPIHFARNLRFNYQNVP
jgi:hypothetical protein